MRKLEQNYARQNGNDEDLSGLYQYPGLAERVRVKIRYFDARHVPQSRDKQDMVKSNYQIVWMQIWASVVINVL
jgi:hypothetical protein